MTQPQCRRLQILAVAAGVASTLLALGGGVVENATAARMGVAGFLASLTAVVGMGIYSWRRFR